MNPQENLILLKGEDLTSDVKWCQYNPAIQRYHIEFMNGKAYDYAPYSLQWLRKPEVYDKNLVHVSLKNGKPLYDVNAIYVFKSSSGSYWHISCSSGFEKTYPESEIHVENSALGNKTVKNCFAYLSRMAAVNELKNEDGEVLLTKQYEKIDFLSEDTAMAVYLHPEKYPIRHNAMPETVIYPFGGNASQCQAVENALTNQISVIQGPPGTGKTQTILNIIANLILQGKTVAVVSSNNSATKNVYDKLSLPENNLGFIAASLGSTENKKGFIEKQMGLYPDFSSWQKTPEEKEELLEKIKGRSRELTDIYENQNKLANFRRELEALETEKRCFSRYRDENDIQENETSIFRKLKTEQRMQFWQECVSLSEKCRQFSFWDKLRNSFRYGIWNWKIYQKSLIAITAILQDIYYDSKESELKGEISALEQLLKSCNSRLMMKELSEWSMAVLRAKLCGWYHPGQRTIFTEDILWKKPQDFLLEYPVILSTTFSSISSLKNVRYDYLIMDEASQVDLATGALALSCAANAIIVGDLKQLPNVLKNDMKIKSEEIFQSFNLPEGYSYADNSFLKSVCTILPDAPQTLLREHYRCHPKIIGFCNQKFYDNELVILTEDHGEKDALKVFKTAAGEHRRDHMNQRQIDVLKNEAIAKMPSEAEDIGIISPYRDQVEELRKQIGNGVEIDTVHKYQGREKDTIIMTTVDDVATDFSDDPYLLNVAISRAKKRFYLITSGNEQPSDSNIRDLIDYIEYNNFEVVQSDIYSVFDLLYRDYTEERLKFLAQHRNVSEYDSENIMYGTICDILEDGYKLLKTAIHYPLKMLIRDPHLLEDDRECEYAMRDATHVDFLIYNSLTKKPVLVIEVDGFHFHKEGTKQYERDRLKDSILERYKIPLLRLGTNGSGEKEKIRAALKGAMPAAAAGRE